MRRFIVLWNRPGYGLAFEADVTATTPREARAAFRAMFPLDTVKAVKLPRGNGRFV
ncbi:hypothetical protein [Methylobacterium fujisawaense]